MTTGIRALLIFALLATGCAANKPIVDYDQSTDFAAYRDFAFLSEHPMIVTPDTPPVSPLLEGRMMRVIDGVLASKGFTRVSDPESADFTVGFTVGARDKIRVQDYPPSYRVYYGGRGGLWGASYYGAFGAREVDVQQYTEGTLAIDIYDVAEHKPVWHGVATKRVTDEMRRNPDESINEAVSAILEAFPPVPPAPTGS